MLYLLYHSCQDLYFAYCSCLLEAVGGMMPAADDMGSTLIPPAAPLEGFLYRRNAAFQHIVLYTCILKKQTLFIL